MTALFVHSTANNELLSLSWGVGFSFLLSLAPALPVLAPACLLLPCLPASLFPCLVLSRFLPGCCCPLCSLWRFRFPGGGLLLFSGPGVPCFVPVVGGRCLPGLPLGAVGVPGPVVGGGSLPLLRAGVGSGGGCSPSCFR
eukprot:15449156-Alexandrium_andersonii.AAC.1